MSDLRSAGRYRQQDVADPVFVGDLFGEER